ncbi:MAG: polyprenyl synthetase family protein [Desulfobacterales bacterium]
MSDLKHKILEAVKDDLQAIENELAANLTPHLDLVREVAGHILFSGGKRLRPLLMVLSARVCGYSGSYDKTFSTALEYLHAATLLHDDLVDGASLRRGKPVANRLWGNSVAVLVGDFLLARALAIAAGTERIQVVRILAELTEAMSQGEIHQLLRKGDISLSEDEYLEVIRRKTALLFQAACRVSAVLADAPAERQSALAEFGFNLGMAFQVVDDLLDYVAETPLLGKEPGADLREGKLTLPLIHVLRSARSTDRKWVKKMVQLQNTMFTAEDFQKLIGLMRDSGALRYTEKVAALYVEKAKAALALFPPSSALDTLLDIADYTLSRKA